MSYERQKRWHARNRWSKIIENAARRCMDPRHKMFKWYGGRGIEFRLTTEEKRALWARDGAKNMARPSLDRIDSNGHYEFSNCRFIEFKENLRLARDARAAGLTPPIVEAAACVAAPEFV